MFYLQTLPHKEQPPGVLISAVGESDEWVEVSMDGRNEEGS
jgi:hypothetical protein